MTIVSYIACAECYHDNCQIQKAQSHTSMVMFVAHHMVKSSGVYMKQVDVLPSKNQALCCKLNLLIYCHSMYCNEVM